jgi:glycosyltransferase involved in cell wall biosynthesis
VSIIKKLHKDSFIKLKILLWHYIILWFHRIFNPVVWKQLKNHKRIPIIIISFNQLHYLRQLIEFLLKHEYTNIVILDNKSTYPPLLDYFKQIEKKVTIHRLSDNLGHLSFWKHDDLFKTYSRGYYVVTDADIVPLDTCPDDFLKTFRQLLDQAFNRTKVGFSLMLDDIPDSNPNKAPILQWESKYWKSVIRPNVFKAEIDTTFALYRPNYNYKLKHFTKAWRTNYPITAKHGGWYLDMQHLTEEQAYYMKTANASASWQVNTKGELINPVHKTLYSNEH